MGYVTCKNGRPVVQFVVQLMMTGSIAGMTDAGFVARRTFNMVSVEIRSIMSRSMTVRAFP